ncbi:hypothetical protein Ppa06_48230 [Planomonospora parontospora subsp. parontospora]|uniref:Uncharacterized protein n=2 Tax=Planomonospora parontospora TaxID=58119 RepID=A0AA37BJJ7_9ACTN|nr:hypothetical protein GCM10010126_46370 [Planomonospora parontospora]GII11025.1 hypothetical protein Ppa06_48230 [Planomonospora parontospora subsp. parontospora]
MPDDGADAGMWRRRSRKSPGGGMVADGAPGERPRVDGRGPADGDALEARARRAG